MSGALRRASSEKRRSAEVQRATVFLDSNVLSQFVEGKLDWLFSPAALQKFSYAINPIVLQEGDYSLDAGMLTPGRSVLLFAC